MRRFRLKSQSGLSLVEILIVLTLLVAASTLAINANVDKGRELKRYIYKFSLYGKEIQTQAKLFNTTYRMVINLGNDDDPEQSVWIEKSSKPGLFFKGESTVAQRLAAQKEGKDESELDDLPKSPFIKDDSIIKDIKVLDPNLRISDLESVKTDKPTIEGLAYIYFFPQGLIDQVALHFETLDQKKKWTITFHPLTATPKVFGKDVSLKDIYAQ